MLSSSRGEPSASHQVSAHSLRFALLLLPLLVLLAPRDAEAYQWMLKHGYPTCGGCHTDPAGGELLTLYGRMQSEVTLSTPWGGSGDAAASAQSTRPRLMRNPLSLAAGAKLADKKGAAAEKVELEEAEEPAEGEATAESREEPSAEAEAAPAEPEAAEEEDDGLGPITPFLFGLLETPDWLLLGGSYRHLNVIKPSGAKKFSTFPMMMDIYGQFQFGGFKFGGSLGAVRVAAGSPFARAAQVTTNQGKQWNLISRTHYVGYDVTTEFQVRAGRLNLPFGVRIPEHVMWVRQATRTDRESAQQHGVSASYNHESFRVEIMGIAGNYQLNPDRFRERGYSGYFEYFVTPKTVVGISSLYTSASEDRLLVDKQRLARASHGAMVRSTIGERVVVAIELDALFRSRFEPGYVGFAQVDYELTQGLHFMLTGELLDEGYSRTADASVPRSPGSGKPKLGGWLSAAWWFLPHFDVRLDAIQRTNDDLQFLAQLHVYL
ncbi:MAG TPA: hypothetical protein VEX18_12615 [Polyangiaceae bacterium]|nr:hypothetical protein [Polyangiaceae bacterium]